MTGTSGRLAGTLGSLNPMRYRSYYFDTETGYYYLQSRYYDAGWGRFINADNTTIVATIEDIGVSMNLYAYSNNNPTNSIDPTGQLPLRLVYAAAGAALFGGVSYLIGKMLGLSGWTLKKIVLGLGALGALAAAILGPKLLAKAAPKLASWLKKISRGTKILKSTQNKKKVKLSHGGITILDGFKLMFHPPHAGKHNFFHIQIEVKIPGAKTRWKVIGRVPIKPKKWFK